MKRQVVVFVLAAMFALAIGVQNISSVLAQQLAEGPIGELSSLASENGFAGDVFSGNEFGGAGVASSPNVVYSPQGEAIEVFNPSVSFEQNSQATPNLLATPVADPNTKTDWITPDGRINLDNGSPESQLWAPDDSSAGGWKDGPLGFQLGIDGLFFSRGLDGGSSFATNNAGESFSNADFDFDTETTARYRLGLASEYGTGFEFVYYDFNEFSGTLSLTGAGITPTFFGGNPAEAADSYTATYQSRIKNAELNVWSRRSERIRVGYGLRYISVQEQYDITLGADSGTAGSGNTGGSFSGFFSKTDNDLFGGQIMLELFHPVTSSMYLEGGVKGLLLNNDADLDVDTANFDLSGDDSFVTGGVNFNGGVSYRALRGVHLRAGYEGVFIGSVASGAAQSESNSVFDGFVIPTGESLYYGGGYAGCTVTF